MLLTPLGVELVLGRLEELLDDDGDARMRDIAAGFSDEAAPSAGSSSSSDVLVGSVLYFVQSASTWARERAGRFSRLAARLSKQYAQWAWVAMVLAGRGARRKSGRAENRWRAIWAFRTSRKRTGARKRDSK
jgi:hypothetical protein